MKNVVEAPARTLPGGAYRVTGRVSHDPALQNASGCRHAAAAQATDGSKSRGGHEFFSVVRSRSNAGFALTLMAPV